MSIAQTSESEDKHLLVKQALPTNLKPVHFAIRFDNVTECAADVLALKYANALFGADRTVAKALGKTEDEILQMIPTPNAYKLFPGLGRIEAKQALFLNVGDLYSFNYAAIRQFASQVLKVLIQADVPTRHLAMTIHGVGYGLDEAEVVRAQLAGYLDAFESGYYPPEIELITIIERDIYRAERLRAILDEAIPTATIMVPKVVGSSISPTIIERSPQTSNVGRESAAKPHVFVAMPFAEEMEDVYHYGIQSPVNAAGYLCERVDIVPFSGDILDRIKERIETASFVVAELTGANPNVFLEVGYAWGKDRPTILLVQDAAKLPFDVRGQRCLIYKNIRDLEKRLAEELEGLARDFA